MVYGEHRAEEKESFQRGGGWEPGPGECGGERLACSDQIGSVPTSGKMRTAEGLSEETTKKEARNTRKSFRVREEKFHG